MTQRRRRKRHISYPAALAAAVLLVAKREVLQRAGLGLWGPVAARLVARKLGARTPTELALRVGGELLRRARGRTTPKE